MQKIIHSNLFFSFCLNVILFASFFILFTSRFNTDTDIYFLYTLSGEFGGQPSGLLHYSDVAHPLLSFIISFFFNHFPSFNWYSFFLVLFHFISCMILFYSFLNFFRKRYAMAAFFIFFLFIECRLLLWLDFSGASLVGTICGSVSLLLYFKSANKVLSKQVLICGLIILSAGLIRLHYMALFCAFTSWMGLFLLPRLQLIRFIKVIFFIGLLVILLFQQQRYYFKAQIPGWNSEEKMRKAYIYYSNHPHTDSLSPQTGIDKVKQDLINICVPYAKDLIDYAALKKFSKDNTRLLNIPGTHARSWYWLFKDIRPYLFLFVVILLFLSVNRTLKSLWSFSITTLFLVIAFFILAMFFKITEVILVTILSSILFSGILFLSYKISRNKWVEIAKLSLLILSCGWMGVRIAQTSHYNIERIQFTHHVMNELKAHDRILFIDAGSFLNFNLAIWDVPKDYPLRNYIYKELFFSNSYSLQLDKFGIADLMKAIPLKDNIYLIGKKADPLIEYYKLVYDQPVEIRKSQEFQYNDVYQVKSGQPK